MQACASKLLEGNSIMQHHRLPSFIAPLGASVVSSVAMGVMSVAGLLPPMAVMSGVIWLHQHWCHKPRCQWLVSLWWHLQVCCQCQQR